MTLREPPAAEDDKGPTDDMLDSGADDKLDWSCIVDMGDIACNEPPSGWDMVYVCCGCAYVKCGSVVS